MKLYEKKVITKQVITVIIHPHFSMLELFSQPVPADIAAGAEASGVETATFAAMPMFMAIAAPSTPLSTPPAMRGSMTVLTRISATALDIMLVRKRITNVIISMAASAGMVKPQDRQLR